MTFGGILAAILFPLLIILLGKIIKFKLGATKAPLPPQPKPKFLVGNLFDLTNDITENCRRYDEWCKELDTDVLYLNMLGTKIIVLNSFESSCELLDKRSSIHSGRSESPMLYDLMGWSFNFVFIDYGDRWRLHRKLMQQQFNVSAAKEFRPHQVKAARQLVKTLFNNPSDHVFKDIRQMSGEIIISITYGLEVKPSNDPYIEVAEAGVQPLLEATIPGAYLVDFLPILKYVPTWFPGAEFKRKAREWKRLAQNMLEMPYAATKEAINNGTANPSFVKSCLSQLSNTGDSSATEHDIKSIAGTMYQAGSDTTAVTLAACILLLLEHPDDVKKAQKEIDSVLIPGTFPEFNDESTLPYITAIIKEAMRHQVPTPIAVPHTSNADDIYKGYLIPASATLVPNVWAILRDEEVFPEPHKFIPERFLENDETAEARLEVVWGYGRRICSGRYMAFSTVWIALASILAVYDIYKPTDENGNVIESKVEWSSSILPVPSPFKAVFKPRSKEAEELIESDYGIQASI